MVGRGREELPGRFVVDTNDAMADLKNPSGEGECALRETRRHVGVGSEVLELLDNVFFGQLVEGGVFVGSSISVLDDAEGAFAIAQPGFDYGQPLHFLRV